MKKTRRIVQFGFLALTLVAVYAVGANAERWCPFGGVEALYTYAHEGSMICSLGTSNFYILGGVVLMTLLVRRAFCSYMCPIGTIAEWLRGLAQRVGVPEVRVSGAADRALSLLKYVVLGLILYFTWRAGELLFRGFDPCYALISRHGVDISFWAYVVAGTIVVVSLAVMLPFCRWFCPFAAVLHLFSAVGLGRIKRDEAACTGCRACARACPMAIPVDRLAQVTAPRCTSCMNCIDACPTTASGALSWGPAAPRSWKWSQAALIAILLSCTAGAVAASYVFPMPSFVKSRGTLPDRVATAELRMSNLHCRGRANYLFYFLNRDDELRVPGYLKIEAWPGPGMADVRITYDPGKTDEAAIKRAMTELYYNDFRKRLEHSPFQIEGYDPLGLGPLGLDLSGDPAAGLDFLGGDLPPMPASPHGKRRGQQPPGKGPGD